MRHGSNSRRQRNRGGSGRRGGQSGPSRTQVYDSNGPDVRIRGTAHQVAEKYVALAKDAASTGDNMMEQNYLQHAEHYQRIINSWGENNQAAASSSDTKSSSDDHSSRNSKADAAEPGNEKHSESAGSGVEDLGLPPSILGDAPKASKKEDELTS